MSIVSLGTPPLGGVMWGDQRDPLPITIPGVVGSNQSLARGTYVRQLSALQGTTPCRV